MKKVDIGQTVSILANIGVIAGIIFLGVEIQQNNEALAVQARLDREDVFRQGVARRFQTPEMVRAVAKSNRGDPLTDEESLILDWENHSVMIDWMLVYMQVHDGILEEETIPVELWRIAFRDIWPRMSESWVMNKRRYTPEFVEWMEENIVGH